MCFPEVKTHTMSGKRHLVNVDPDYEDVTDQQNKRQKVFEKDAKDATVKKIERIIIAQFGTELQNKEHEVIVADQRLCQSRLMMDRLRACIVANYYGSADQQRYGLSASKQSIIHPAVKAHIGKTVKDTSAIPHTSITDDINNIPETKQIEAVNMTPVVMETEQMKSKLSVGSHELRDSRFKVKKRIIVGNVAKYIPMEKREGNDQSTHKWMVYVRGPIDNPRIDSFVKKIWIFLHPSYRPNDLVEISQPPFHLTRRGWGEFPIRIQLHFTDGRNKKVDIIHNLKLDRTYTGLQTLGAETVVDVELEREYSSDISLPTPLGICSTSNKSIGNFTSTTTSSNKNLAEVNPKFMKCDDYDENGENGHHTIVHSPMKSTEVKSENQESSQQSVKSNIEETTILDPDQESLNSRLKEPTMAAKSPISAALQSDNKCQTVYLRCKDAKGNILLVPKMIVNKENAIGSKNTVTNVTNEMTSFKLTNQSSLIKNTIAAGTISQPNTSNLLARVNTQLASLSKPNVFATPPRPSIKLMVTSKGLQALPQTSGDNSTLQTTNKQHSLLNTQVPTPHATALISGSNCTQQNVKAHSLLQPINCNLRVNSTPVSYMMINSASNTQQNAKSHSLLTLSNSNRQTILGAKTPQQSVKTHSLLTPTSSNPQSQKPTSLLLNSVSPVNKFQITCDGATTSTNKLHTTHINKPVPVLIQNNPEKLISGNSAVPQVNRNAMTSAATKASGHSPQVVLASMGSKTFLLQMQADDHVIQSNAVSLHPHIAKPTVIANDINSSVNLVDDKVCSNFTAANQYMNLTVKQQLQEQKIKIESGVNVLEGNKVYDRELDRKTHVWKKNKVKVEEQCILPLRVEDYPDMISIIKSAVKRHPIVQDCTDRSLHPYCAHSYQQWLSWNIGKRRASEWQRASWVRKFICDNLKGEVFQGKQLWSTKQIMYWCRLHGFSPHYLENKLENNKPVVTEDSKSKPRLINSLTDVNQIINQLPEQISMSDSSDDDIDILNLDSPPIIKVKLKEEIMDECCDPPIFIPPSNQAVFIQDTCQKIGVKFKPTDLEENVFGSVCEDMIYSAMKHFLEDCLRDSFAFKQNRSKSDDTIHIEDVQQSLKNSSNTNFITNAHLGLKPGDIFPTFR